MAHDDSFFTPDRVDEQIDLLSDSSTRAPASAEPPPAARLIEDLRDLQAEASLEHSLKRAWDRLEQSRTRTASAPLRGRYEPLSRPDAQEERPSLMDMKSPISVVPDGRKLISRLGVMAAAAVLIALMSGLTTGLILIRQHKTGEASTATATVQPTATTPSVPTQTNLYLDSIINGTISKFDPINRTILWNYQWNTQKDGAFGFGPLVVGDGTVYFSAGAASGQNSVQLSLYAIDAQYGALRWKQQQLEQPYVVLAEKGVVYVTAADGLYALSASDGSGRWHAPVNSDSTYKLVLANGALYGTTFHEDSANQWLSTLFAVNAADGSVLWQSALPRGKSFTVTAVVNGILYLSSVEQKYPSAGALIALDDGKPKVSYAYAYSLDGKQLWQSQQIDGYISNPTNVNGTIYFASANTMYALDANTGSTRWYYQVSTGNVWGVEGNPIIANGNIYLESGPYSSSTTVPTTLIALDAQNGAVQWKQQVNDPRYDMVSTCVLANAALFVIGGYPASLQAFSIAGGKSLWQMSLGKNLFEEEALLIAAP
jgi:outer membrane protein assembly factor BamB